MSNPTELPDLDKLEALANTVRSSVGYGDFIAAIHKMQDELDASTVLSLIALARRAQPEGEAPQADPYKLDDDDEVRYPNGTDVAIISAKRYYELRGFEEAATLSPLCGAQHAESGAADDEWRVGEFWSSANPGQKTLMLSRAAQIERDGEHKDFIRWVATPSALAAQQAAAPGGLDDQVLVILTLGGIDGGEYGDNDIEVASSVRLEDLQRKMVHTAESVEIELIARPLASAPGTPEAPKGGV